MMKLERAVKKAENLLYRARSTYKVNSVWNDIALDQAKGQMEDYHEIHGN